MPKVGRNDPCYCGSGKKFKKCCGLRDWCKFFNIFCKTFKFNIHYYGTVSYQLKILNC
jgi:hypothetical protein